MKHQKSIKKNFIFNSILSLSAVIFPLISFPYVSRILLPVGNGKVAFATSIIYYFNMFAQLGIPTYGIRACAKVRDDKEELTRTVQEIMIINLVTCAITYICLFVALLFVPKFQDEKPLFLIISLTLIFNAIGVNWLYKALEQYRYIAIRSVLFKLIALIAMFLLIKEKEDYVLYGAISIFAASASNILNFVRVRQYISLRPVGEYCFQKHLKAIVIFFSMSVATTIYTNLDTVMLGFMVNEEEVGYYNTAVKVKSVLVSIVTSLGVVLLPRSSYYIEQGLLDEFRKITKKALNFVVLFSVPLLSYFILFAKQCINVLAGMEYDSSIVPMQIIMPTLLFIGLTNILGIQVLVPLGKEKDVLRSEIAGAIVDLILNMIFIPMYGAAGAAIGTVFAELVVLIVQYRVLRDIVKDEFKEICYTKIIVALIVSCAISVWVHRINVGDMQELIISACCFFLGYGCILLVWKEPFMLDLWRIFISKLKHKNRR